MAETIGILYSWEKWGLSKSILDLNVAKVEFETGAFPQKNLKLKPQDNAHPLELLLSKKYQVISVGKDVDVENLDFSCIAGKNVKLCGSCRKQFESF